MSVARPTALSFHALHFAAPPDNADELPLPMRPALRWLGGVEAVWDAAGSSAPDAAWWLWLGCWGDAAAARDAVHDAAQ